MKLKKVISELEYVEWKFYFYNNTLWLDKYIIFSRETKRQKKYRMKTRYERIMSRDSNITLEEVPLTEEIKQEALGLFTSQITVQKWDK